MHRVAGRGGQRWGWWHCSVGGWRGRRERPNELVLYQLHELKNIFFFKKKAQNLGLIHTTPDNLTFRSNQSDAFRSYQINLKLQDSAIWNSLPTILFIPTWAESRWREGAIPRAGQCWRETNVQETMTKLSDCCQASLKGLSGCVGMPDGIKLTKISIPGWHPTTWMIRLVRQVDMSEDGSGVYWLLSTNFRPWMDPCRLWQREMRSARGVGLILSWIKLQF